MHMDGIDKDTWQHHAWLNRLQSAALLLFLGGFLALLGWLIWGGIGILVLLSIGLSAALTNPTVSPRWVMRLYGATRLGAANAPRLVHVTERLAERAALPAPPQLYYVPSRVLNAFAVGSPGQSAIALTDGMLRRLELPEIIAVLAHEMSHIRNNDLWVMGLADMFSRATSLLSLLGQLLLIVSLPLALFSMMVINWAAILLLIFAPTLSSLAQLALSRTREYDADLNAVRLTGDPDALASALAKIERIQGGWLERVLLPGRGVPEPSLLRTHPDTGDRIARLMALKASGQEQGSWARLAKLSRDQDAFGRPVKRPPRWHVTGLWH